MSLPDVCPLDSTQSCKGKECHLYCVEWRTQEPLCLVGYSSTSKVSSGKVRYQDTYAEDTFRKLGKHPVSGPHRLASEAEEDDLSDILDFSAETSSVSGEDPAENRKKKAFKPWPDASAGKRRERPVEKPHELKSAEAEKASLRLEARLRGEPVNETETLTKKPPVQERVISNDAHTTLIGSFSGAENPSGQPVSKDDSSEKKHDEPPEKRRKLNEVMELELPEDYEEEFWS